MIMIQQANVKLISLVVSLTQVSLPYTFPVPDTQHTVGSLIAINYLLNSNGSTCLLKIMFLLQKGNAERFVILIFFY